MIIVKGQSRNFFEKILTEPFSDADDLAIVSGYATAAMVEQQLTGLKERFGNDNLRISLIVGMTPVSGISEAQHRGFVDFSKQRLDDFKCSYLPPNHIPVHSKLYVWRKGNRAVKAFLSSANYTVNAFLRGQDEIASECDPNSANGYFSSLIPASVYCTHPEAQSLVVSEKSIWDREQREGTLLGTGGSLNIPKPQSVRLPLFSERENRIQDRSGLNWGQRPEAAREPNQAYIPVPVHVHRENPGFFPPKGEQFTVLTTDGFPFICSICQQGDKAIESSNNSDFGRYFRCRLGIPEGEKVKLEDLDRFGNRYVTFHKISDEEYIMDFEPSLPPI